MPGALVDFGLYFFHNAQRLIDLGKGPYFYLPKTESHLEARLWNDIFVFAQDYVGIPQGTVRATVLIETITAAYEMEEILYELRDHASGLNAGRWDYLFSIVKNFRDGGSKFVLPDRNPVTMTAPFMRAYTELLVRTCHKRGAHAIGGMAAFIPSRRDAEVNKVAFEKVKADKDREADDGFDGSWVAHPDLVPIAMESFDAVLGDRPNQKDRLREDVSVAAGDLIAIDTLDAKPTYDGLRNAVAVGIRYIEAWLRGMGAVAIFNLMEDAATAEISRSQIWQWINADVVFENGEHATADLARKVAAEELADDPRGDRRRGLRVRQVAAGPRPAAPGLAGPGLRGLPDAAGVRAAALNLAPEAPHPASHRSGVRRFRHAGSSAPAARAKRTTVHSSRTFTAAPRPRASAAPAASPAPSPESPSSAASGTRTKTYRMFSPGWASPDSNESTGEGPWAPVANPPAAIAATYTRARIRAAREQRVRLIVVTLSVGSWRGT